MNNYLEYIDRIYKLVILFFDEFSYIEFYINVK